MNEQTNEPKQQQQQTANKPPPTTHELLNDWNEWTSERVSEPVSERVK